VSFSSDLSQTSGGFLLKTDHAIDKNDKVLPIINPLLMGDKVQNIIKKSPGWQRERRFLASSGISC